MAIKLLEIIFGNNLLEMTPEGGICETLINGTGSASAKGTIVVASKAADGAVSTAPAGSVVPIGVIYESGVANGGNVKVVTSGMAEVLLASDQTATHGYWCGVSNSENGRMYQLADAPIGTSTHNQEIGHCLETVSSAGSLALVQLHFN